MEVSPHLIRMFKSLTRFFPYVNEYCHTVRKQLHVLTKLKVTILNMVKKSEKSSNSVRKAREVAIDSMVPLFLHRIFSLFY